MSPDGTLWMIEERALTKVGLLWDAYYDAIRASGRGGRMPPAPQGEPCSIGEPVIGIRRRETQLQTPQT